MVHGPYRESACLECHDPHGGPTRAHLRSEDDAGTCGRCHRRSPDAHDHAPHAAGECITCHEPHQSDHRGLLVESGNALCARCHADVSDRLSTLSRVHGPAAADCTLCHHPHGSGIDMLLHREPTSLCLTCHDAVRERIDLDPHVHGIIRTEDGCAGCHDPHASHTPGLLRAEAAKSCLECHGGDSPGTLAHSIRSGRFKHGPVVEGECYACHVPHSSRHPHLLRAAFPEEFYRDYSEEDYALCYGCHPPALVQVERTTTLTGFRDGDRNLHYVHVAGRLGRTCRACHEVHASDLPFHMRESVPYGPNDWELPINFEKTPTGGSCAPGCHLEMAYDNTRP